MQKIYILEHNHDKSTPYYIKQLGIYTSHQLAEEAINRFIELPGFIDSPDGFYIVEYIIGEEYFPERPYY